ncbi:MAG: DUF2892 domain-containing protein [Rhodanobacteraceae bacterium]|nr:DUF2892 domain-containing protein [Xanthomonadales bacterium]MCP5478187.1 DUF2892 domain-containing protein [Rhodanobacteraceae bacterium]HPF74765.1 DUF2892 domain-containing protein [Xanthomonadaceae bacterium]HRY00984.1 DUF2892 domain-containing protein [Xanthomonadaceae bacterium]
MTIERAVIRFAGFMVMLSVVLTLFVSPWFWVFTAFIGLNLFQYSFTGFCPAAMVMKRMGIGQAACAS